MSYLITLHLPPPHNALAYVESLPVLRGVRIDREYGSVLINPKRDLYVIRVGGPLDAQSLVRDHPEIKGVHGDVRIAPFGSNDAAEE